MTSIPWILIPRVDILLFSRSNESWLMWKLSCSVHLLARAEINMQIDFCCEIYSHKAQKPHRRRMRYKQKERNAHWDRARPHFPKHVMSWEQQKCRRKYKLWVIVGYISFVFSSSSSPFSVICTGKDISVKMMIFLFDRFAGWYQSTTWDADKRSVVWVISRLFNYAWRRKPLCFITSGA